MYRQELSTHPSRETGPNGRARAAPSALVEPWGTEELAATLDSVATGVWAVDLEGRCVFVNQAACRIFGYSREKCVGRRLPCILHGNNPDGWNCPKETCRIQKALESGSAAELDDEVFLHRDGTPLAVQCSVQPIVMQGRMRGAVITITDVTRQKRAEESLRKSDEWLGFAQRAAGVGIFDADLKTGVTRVSEEQFLIYGLDPAGEWPSHEEWLKLIHPEDRDRLDRGLELALSGVQFPGTEFRIVWPDGNIHWLLSQVKVFFDEAGTATRQVGVNIDVTSRVRAETVLSQFFSASPTPMAIWGFDGRVQRVNPAWEPILGFTAAEVEGTQLFDRVHPDDRAAAAAALQKVTSSGKLTGFECRVRCEDGSYRWLLVNGGVLQDAQVILATANDITKRKRAEEALRESEARFRSAFENTLFGMAIIALDGRYLQVNQSLCRITGFSEQELLQRDFAALTHPDDLRESLEFSHTLMEGVKSGGITTKRYVRKDGEPVWVSVHLALVRDALGKPLHFISLVEDLSERKRAEENARKSEEWLKFALNAAGVGLCHRESGVTTASEQQFRLYGLEPAEKWISRERWLQSIHPADRERVEMEQRLAIEQGRPYDIQFRVIWPDGSVHWLLCRGKILHDDRGAGKIEVTADVTEGKRAEAALNEFFALSRSPMAIFGFDGSINRVNAALLETSGLTAEELAQRPVTEFFHPDDRPMMQEEFGKLITRGGNSEFECRGLRKDGSFVPLLFFATAAPDERLIFAVAHNITERKRAEEALRESEAKFRELFDCAPVAYHELDMDGVVRRVNRAQCAMLGYEAGEMSGRPIWEFVADREVSREAVRKKLSGEQPLEPVQRRYTRRDGSQLWAEAHSVLVRNATGETAGIRTALLDITERKRAEEALRESEDKFRELFDCAPVAYHELDMDGVVRRVNRAECALLGYEAGEMLGRPAWEFIAGADREASREAVRRKLSGEQPLAPYQRRYVRRDGAELWAEVHETLVRNATGETAGIRTALLDITERKRLANTLELNFEKLARSNEELERFAYVASHDLQEPLRMVASFTQLLAKRYSGRLDETADRYIHYAVDGAKRMQELIADLLAYSRVNSKELDLRQTDCEAVVLEAMRNLQVVIEESGACIDWDPLPALWVDQGQLAQVFQNLLGNAVKFRRKEECPRIHVSAVDSGAEWMISVQDNGIGIDARHAERIFQMFQRLHTRAEYPGTGIGLAVCKKVVERHGGKLWVESEPGAGSTFRFTIPKPERNGIGGDSANQTSRDSVD